MSISIIFYYLSDRTSAIALKRILPLVLTGILCICITLLISYWIWGTGKRQASMTRYNLGLVEAAEKGKASVVFIYTLTSDTAMYFEGSQTG